MKAKKFDPGGNTRLCTVPRWQYLKTTLENLNKDQFLKSASEIMNAVILDVRTREEFKNGHIPGAVNFNYLSSALADEIDNLDPSKTYFVYCKTGRRSLRVCILLKNSGFKNIYNLDGGLGY